METLHSLGDYEKTSLTEATRKMNQFRNVISSNKMKDHELFYPAWGSLYSSYEIINTVYGLAKDYGFIRFLEAFRLGSSIKKIRSRIDGIRIRYREDYGPVKIKRYMQERFPSSIDPSIKELDEIIESILNEIVQEGYDILETLTELHGNVSELSRKAIINKRKRIENEIRDIQKMVITLS